MSCCRQLQQPLRHITGRVPEYLYRALLSPRMAGRSGPSTPWPSKEGGGGAEVSRDVRGASGVGVSFGVADAER
ncbi:hypothetical protein KC315_g30 [Hortaea werneckii]|nr:hypothetical protein KC315_g30 [Hortaea werneckii]